MTTYGRSARVLRRYGPWTLVVTTATIAAAYGLNRSAPADYVSEATVLVEAGLTGAAASAPDIGTEREVALSDAVVSPAAGGLQSGTTAFRDGLTVEALPGTRVLRITYTAGNRFSAQVRARVLLESYADFRKDGPVAVRVLTAPGLPETPVTRPLGRDLAAGAAAGLLLGASTALLRARTRGRIRSRDDFARLAGSPVLATVPRHRGPGGTTAGAPVVLGDPGSPAAESYRYLRSRLLPSLRPTGTTTILVTSPGDRQGRTTTAANLAVTLARSGRSVILVDADLRNPRLHDVFQVPGDHGLTMLLDGDATVSGVLEETAVPQLRLIPAGRRDGDLHADLSDSGRLARVLRALEKHADVVILDSSAVLSSSDAIVLAALADQVLLVGDFARTGRETVRRALAELAEAADGNVRPVLVNVPRSAGALVPRAGAVPAPASGQAPLTHHRLTSDADDVAPPGVTTHAYVDDDRDPLADFYARTATIAVPVIYGSTQTATVYASSTATMTEEPSDPDEPAEATEPGADPGQEPDDPEETEVQPEDDQKDEA